MNAKAVETLEELLANADKTKASLRVRFVSHEVYDLTSFLICEAVKVFLSDTAMLFHLNDVSEIHATSTGKLLFKS